MTAKSKMTTPIRVPPPTLQVAFSFDTTGSMSGALREVRGRLSDMLQRLQTDIPAVNTAVVAHGDYQDVYVTKHVDFTNSLADLVDFVNNVGTTGGGDEAEAYEAMLRLVRRDLHWAPASQKVLVVIGDAFPHPPNFHLNKKKIDWEKETLKLQEMGVRIYGVQVYNSAQSTEFFITLTKMTGGQHLQLSQFETFCDVMAICYRKKGAELSNYEVEVGTREGRADLYKDLEGVFGVLKRADSSASAAAAPSASKIHAAPKVTPPLPIATNRIPHFIKQLTNKSRCLCRTTFHDGTRVCGSWHGPCKFCKEREGMPVAITNPALQIRKASSVDSLTTSNSILTLEVKNRHSVPNSPRVPTNNSNENALFNLSRGDQSSFIKITGLNVCGLNRKMKNPKFVEFVKSNDMLCMCETMLGESDDCNIVPEYTLFKKNRLNYKRKSGGVGVFVKNYLLGNMTFLEHVSRQNIENSLRKHYSFVSTAIPQECMLLEFSNPGTFEKLLICIVYAPPEGSDYVNINIFSDIQHCMMALQADKVLIIGDLNAKTGVTEDLCVDKLNALTENVFSTDGLKRFHRTSMDKNTNKLGNALLKFCTDQHMLIVNGRVGRDGNIGKFTCKNASVVDYMVASPSLFPFITDFVVDEFDECLSDVHSAIGMDLLVNVLGLRDAVTQPVIDINTNDKPPYPPQDSFL